MKRRKPPKSQQRQAVEDAGPTEPALDSPPVSDPPETSTGSETDATLPPRPRPDDQAIPRSRMRFVSHSSAGCYAIPTLKGHTMSLVRQAGSTLAIATAVALLGATTPGLAATRTSALSEKASPTAWCKIVIQINTKYGAIRNKRFVSPKLIPLASQRALISASVAHRDQILAVTPTVIKKAMADELTYYASLKARGYRNPALLGPFTIAEAGQLLTYSITKCGLTGY